MSKNLGPIHYMMYEKIKFQDKITSYLLDGKEDSLIFEKISEKPLDEIIDQENIYGFLQEKIDIVEKRLAQALSLAKNPDEKLFELGKTCGKSKDFSSFENIFKDLNLYLLDGMPCDQGLSASVSDNCLYLITTNNLHSKYADEIDLEKSRQANCAGGHGHDHHESFDLKKADNFKLKKEDSSYHKHRLTFLRGYFSNSSYQVDLVDGINYKIYKK